jgi:hypothetical protein
VEILHGLGDQLVAEDLGDLPKPRLVMVEVQNPHPKARFKRQDVLSVELVPMPLLSPFRALLGFLAHLWPFQMASTVR